MRQPLRTKAARSTKAVSLVTAQVTAPDFGLTITPGQVVDLAQRLPQGGTVADVVRAAWFEAIDEQIDAPVTPAEEADHG